MQPIFGHYLSKEGLENLRQHEYRMLPGTSLDQQLGRWWSVAVECVPRSVAPNTLTLLGFLSTIAAMVVALWTARPLESGMCTWRYIVVALGLFAHQTLDGVDGKQARRTNSASPLGQIFDHGCDAFSTVYWAYCAIAAMRLGISVTALSLLSAMQLLLFTYAWLEEHLHVFRCNTGGIGVTEGQVLVIGGHLILWCLSFFSLDSIVLLPLEKIISERFGSVAISILGSSVGNQLLEAQLNCLVVLGCSAVIGLAIAFDMVRGLRRIRNRRQALQELLSFAAHLFFQYLLFFSDAGQDWPLWVAFILSINSSIIVIRMQVSSICRMKYNAFQWPVAPFYVAASVLYVLDARLISSGGVKLLSVCVLACLSFWDAMFLFDFLGTTIRDICDELGISCFSICSKAARTRRLSRSTSKKAR